MGGDFNPVYMYPILFNGAYIIDTIRRDWHGWEDFGISLGNIYYMSRGTQFYKSIKDFEFITNIL